MSALEAVGGVGRPAGDLLGAALDYAARGWPVLPLRPRTKLPATARGFHDASTDPGQVGAWWAAYPDANIGLVCGVGFDVLDVDGDEGAANLHDLGLDLAGVPCAETPHGLHYYFRPSGYGRRIGFLPGLDWLAAGGYVVAPCSAVRDRRPYRWVTPLVVPLQAAPEVIAGLLVVHQQPVMGAAPLVEPPAGQPGLLGLLVLEDRLAEIGQASNGTRNDTLFRVGRGLYGHTAAGQLDPEWVRVGLVKAGLAAGLMPEEVRRTVESAEAIGMAAPLLIPGTEEPEPELPKVERDEGSAILDDVEAALRRFIVYRGEHEPVAVTLWIAHTWAVEAFAMTPYIFFTSPERAAAAGPAQAEVARSWPPWSSRER
jgi:Bifunctional DNA primase/polymerase, N-terminal